MWTEAAVRRLIADYPVQGIQIRDNPSSEGDSIRIIMDYPSTRNADYGVRMRAILRLLAAALEQQPIDTEIYTYLDMARVYLYETRSPASIAARAEPRIGLVDLVDEEIVDDILDDELLDDDDIEVELEDSED